MPPLAITAEDFNSFESALGEIQTAFSNGDLARLRTLVTPEMLGYFSEQLSAYASRGAENRVADVHLLQGDLSEAWQENGMQYATVAMRFSLLDWTVDRASGRVVDGDPNTPTQVTEIWTFVRVPGGNWLLSAIQQGR
jgi:predicted lipid-binding transport protein (Tim44 family)